VLAGFIATISGNSRSKITGEFRGTVGTPARVVSSAGGSRDAGRDGFYYAEPVTATGRPTSRLSNLVDLPVGHYRVEVGSQGFQNLCKKRDAGFLNQTQLVTMRLVPSYHPQGKKWTVTRTATLISQPQNPNAPRLSSLQKPAEREKASSARPL